MGVLINKYGQTVTAIDHNPQIGMGPCMPHIAAAESWSPESSWEDEGVGTGDAVGDAGEGLAAGGAGDGMKD
jgi:hypothetical protein